MAITIKSVMSVAFPAPKLSKELDYLVTQYLDFGPVCGDEQGIVSYALAMSIHPQNKDKIFYILHEDEIGYAVSTEPDLDCPTFFIINGHVIVPDKEESYEIEKLARVKPEVVAGKLIFPLRILIL